MFKAALVVLVALSSSSAALASPPSWEVSSRLRQPAPISFEQIDAAVRQALKDYTQVEPQLGALEGWTCQGVGSRIDSCEVALELPLDWCWYGHFEMSLRFDEAAQKLVTTRYEWANY